MKHSILILSFFVIIAGTTLINCQSSVKKSDDASDKAQNTENYLADTKSDTVKVHQDSTSAYQKFVSESESRINAYEKSIAELKTKIAEKKKSEKVAYEKKLVQLEQKKEALKTEVVNYKDKQIDNWDEKQIEFRKDLDDLGSAIADFFVKNE